MDFHLRGNDADSQKWDALGFALLNVNRHEYLRQAIRTELLTIA
jgi:hypothetical protein